MGCFDVLFTPEHSVDMLENLNLELKKKSVPYAIYSIVSVHYCQARVQVPYPLSQQAPNPDPKVRPSLKNPKPQFFGLG